MSGEHEYPVFNELDVWQPSSYSTFQSRLSMEDNDAEQHLIESCSSNDIGLEDWGSIRVTCACCSRGSLGSHHCSASEVTNGARNFGFGTTNRETLVEVLNAWASATAGREFSDPHLMLLAI